MKLSSQYGLVGIGGLSLLTLVHWLRDRGGADTALGDYLLGVGPNFAAAIAITYVPLGIWADRKSDFTRSEVIRAFSLCAAISGIGLIGWELFQRSSAKLVFDVHDLAATIVGVAFSALLFLKLTWQERSDG